MPVGLLGTLEVVGNDGRPVDIGGSQPRLVLALLVAAAGRAVPTDTLIDAIWGEAPPASAAGTLQTYVSRLRRALASVGATIVREPAGYRLEIDPSAVDANRFEALADQGRAALEAGDPVRARSLLLEAGDLWRGPALLEVRDRPVAAGVARRLDARRLAALEDRLEADLQLGRHAAAVGELAQLVAEHPLREGLWALLALARYRSGQQAEALRAIAHARRTLVDELGVEPGPRLRELEGRILAQDPGLDLPPAPTPIRGGEPMPAPPAPVGETPAPAPVAAVSEQPAIVGRAAELATLRQALGEAMAGAARIAVVEGEAGVGKTRLVEELAAEAVRQSGRVAWGRSLEGGAAPAYWPWLGVLRLLREAAPGRAAAAIDQLLDATGALPAAPAAADRPPILDGVLRLLASGAGPGPLVVVVEDVQWADAGSLELLTQVAAGLSTERVLLVLTLREGEAADQAAVVGVLAAASRRPGTRRLRVEGLAAEATAELVAQVRGRPVDDAVVRVVHERSEGNPFYAIELVRLLDSQGLEDAAAHAAAVPASVRDVVRQRLARLPSSTVGLLQLAAVAGRDVEVELVARAAGRPIDACLDDLEVALGHRLLVEAPGLRPGLRFTHALVREVVVEDLSALRRSRTHLLVADAIEAAGRGDDEAEILAEHLWAAAPIGVGRRAADALDRAADVAIRRFAVEAAIDLLTRSLELRRAAGGGPEDDAAELGTLTTLIWALRARRGYQGGMEHYARAAELARRLGRPEVELEMLWAEWAAFDTACDFERARPVADRFRAWAATAEDPVVRMTGFTTWAIQCWHDGDMWGAAEAFEAASAAREHLPPVADELSLATELVVLSRAFQLYVSEQVGRVADPEAAFAEAAASVTGNFPVAITWCFACTSATCAGDLARVERCARRVLEAEAGETLGFWGSQARMYLAAVMVATGRAGEGRLLFDQAFEDYRAAGMRVGAALMLATAASAEVQAGDLARAERHLEAARDELRLGERYPIPAVLLAEADVLEAEGAPAADVQSRREEAEAMALAQGALVLAGRARAALRGERWNRASPQAPVTEASTSSPSSA